METVVIMTGVRSDYAGGSLAAIGAGSLATGLIFTVVTGGAFDPSMTLGVLVIGLFSMPVWLFGVFMIGLPLWLLLERLRLGGPFAAVALGAVTVGLIWSGFTGGINVAGDAVQELLGPGGMGAFCGGVAGLTGWCVGRRKRPIESQS